MELTFNQKFNTRQEISNILGGDTRKGIAVSAQTNTILLFMNEGEIYTDYFYPTGTYDCCMYTGIGRNGHQDSINNNMYQRNIDVLSHRANKKHLLVFERRNRALHFMGEYQPDASGTLRRVFVFHLARVADTFTW